MRVGVLEVGYAGKLEEATTRVERYQAAFIELMARFGVVRFGEFTLKSGRRSPYFVDAGRFRSGLALKGLSTAYAERIRAAGLEPDVIFGPAYKGVPLSVATAMTLSDFDDRDVGYCFDRKEVKQHGEGGIFVGEPPSPGRRFVIVDDVITSGGSIREACGKLREAASVTIEAVIVAVDREERGRSMESTLTELQRELSVPVLPIVSITDVFDHLATTRVGGDVLIDEQQSARFSEYQREFGVRQ